MQIESRTIFKRFDINFALIILALNIIGLINVYSATHDHGEFSRTFLMQVLWVVLGWLVFLALSFVDYKFLSKLAIPFWIFNVVMLILVTFKGKTVYGAKRWLDLGFFAYQPSETTKLAMVLILASILQKKNSIQGLGFRDLVVPLFFMAVPFLIIVKQPDLGTGMMLAAIAVSMIFFAKVRKGPLITAVVSIMIALPAAWTFALKPYQKDRVFTFLDPGRDPRGAGYNSIQSKIAVGSGETFGKGFLKGTQAQFDFLPERHTDFIYSVLSEEHGFVGSVFTLVLFMVLFVMCIRIASNARDKFGALLVIGFSSYIFWHMFVNIGMVCGLLPIVGVPLPLISYGGTGMLSIMIGLGAISAVSYRRYLF
ncbi:MAG: rod shape-determining protein RodA [Bdellovibrionales bacterium]|nr:rod shape-determining protein RodA [Bdellovibrionales bacterium]